MYNGDDTAHYLSRGFRVVAVEAEPGAAAGARARFAEEISAGDLTVLNVGIASAPGEATFWVCDSHPSWSSFHREIASRSGSTHHPVAVPCIRFNDLLAQFQRPYYIKVDIEGNDRLCVDSLTHDNAPQFLSIEMGHQAGILDIAALYRVGYRRFVCLRQNDFQPIEPRAIARQARAVELGLPPRLARKLFCRLRPRRRRDDGHPFPLGSSGPCSDELGARWLDLAEISSVWSQLSAIHRRTPSFAYWYDIHAARDDSES
jgi:FkbM family methyltransferase